MEGRELTGEEKQLKEAAIQQQEVVPEVNVELESDSASSSEGDSNDGDSDGAVDGDIDDASSDASTIILPHPERTNRVIIITPSGARARLPRDIAEESRRKAEEYDFKLAQQKRELAMFRYYCKRRAE